MSEPLIQIRTAREGAEPSGFDTAIALVPERWYVTVNGKRALLAQLAGRELRDLSEDQAASIGEVLHHADWILAGNPDDVRRFGMMHDCATCRAGVDQALAYLSEHPGAEVAVGQLYWAAQ
ncbi:MAG TPA: hypothetical protein VHT94_07335 [Streptosporangiaceae bacterium]|nr:hypothetical protein [Streptosporangiaceae bacterium]